MQIRSQRGSAVLIASLGLLLLGGLAATTASIVSNNQEGRVVTMQSDQAYALAQAGVEYAKRQLANSLNPVTQNYPLGTGTFTVAAVPNSGQLTVTGNVGNAKKTFSLTTTFGKDCLDIDTVGAHSASDNLTDIKLNKLCNLNPTITDWTISWTPNLGERTIKLQLQGSPLIDLYDNNAGYVSGTKIDSVDYTVTGNVNAVTPINKIQFAANLPGGKNYTITAHLADGSSVTRSFLDPIGGQGNGGGTSFTIDNSQNVVVDNNKTVTINALCAEITYGAGGPEVPVKGWLGVGNGPTWSTLFNGAEIDGGEVSSTTTSAANTKFAIKANAKYKQGNTTLFDATYTSTNKQQVKALVNDSVPPPLAGFGGQKPVSACIAPYLNQATGKVVLPANQVLLLFELGVNMATNPNSTAADFQDLVVLMTIQ